MLLFISYKQHKYYIWRKFQYITCYSLSHSENIHCMDVVLFQYITCYSLSRYRACCVSPFFSFNTSHVTLYPASVAHAWPSAVFQYITCYSLSVSGFSLYLALLCFNTSHVTLYPIPKYSATPPY